MAFDNLVLNPGVISNLSPEFAEAFSNMITVITAAGIVFSVYIILLIIGSVMNFIRNKRIKNIYQKVNEIEEKLNFLVTREKKLEIEELKKDSKEEHKHHKIRVKKGY